MNKWDQGLRYEWALRWDGAGGPKWLYWDANQWVDLGVSGSLVGETWHTLTLQGEISNDQVRYTFFMLDGQAHDLDITVAPASMPGELDRLAVAMQLGGNPAEPPYELFVDHLILNVAAPTPTLSLKEISYYPKDYAWQEMWNHWPEAKVEIDQDLDRITALGFNTVRIFLHPDVFGYPATPSAEELGHFAEALALIDAHGLKAHVNLFDCWGNWADISGSETWLTAVVAPHRDDPRIAIWELKNEIGLDPVTQISTRDWLQALFPLLKTRAGNTPVTVSVSDVEWLDDVKELTGATPPDIYSLHWYPNEVVWTDEFPDIIDRAGELIGQAPLLIGEFGLTTYLYSDNLQSDLVTNVLYYADQKGITNLGFWTLNDFPPDNTLVCCTTSKSDEWNYGLYRTDGTQKPAASILQAAFQGNPPLGLNPRRVLNNLSFEDLNPYSGQLYYWWPWDENWTGQHWEEQDCTKAHTGNCSVKLHGPDGTNLDEPVDMFVGTYNILALPVELGKRYNLEGWVWTENLAGKACITFSWLKYPDNQGKYTWLSNTETCLTEANLTQWKRISIDKAQPPSEATYAEVFVKMSSNDPNSRVWFDDVHLISSVKLNSIGSQDGWVLEKCETCNIGGTLNSSATTLRLGDDATRKQYRSILSFKTGAILPDNAVITSVKLKVKKQGITGGGNPVTMFNGFMADMKKGFFGTKAALQLNDFQAAASKTYGPFKPSPVSGWYTINLTSGSAYINKLSTNNGLTQIRLRFKLGDNNDAVANILKLYSGDASATVLPKLVITYYIP